MIGSHFKICERLIGTEDGILAFSCDITEVIWVSLKKKPHDVNSKKPTLVLFKDIDYRIVNGI